MLTACGERLAAAGFAQYEVSAYAQRGRRCRHNLNYGLWRLPRCGRGAHGKLTSAGQTIAQDGAGPRARRYLAGVPAALTRKNVLWPTALRVHVECTAAGRGIEIETFVERTGLEWQEVAPTVNALVHRKLLIVQGNVWLPSRRAYAFLNDLLLSSDGCIASRDMRPLRFFTTCDTLGCLAGQRRADNPFIIGIFLYLW